MDLPPDPGPAPRLQGHHLVVYMVARLDELEAKLEEHHKGAAHWRFQADRASRRSDYINIFLVSAHGLWMSLGAIGGMLAGSYVVVYHNWYVQRIIDWFHGLI